jgi:hypothetical protein
MYILEYFVRNDNASIVNETIQNIDTGTIESITESIQTLDGVKEITGIDYSTTFGKIIRALIGQ